MTCSRMPFAAVVTASLSLLAWATAAKAGAAETPRLEGTAWVLAELPGRTLPAGAFATLRFDRDRVTGHDGCNGFTVPYKAEGGTLEVILEGPSTMMDCPPERTEMAHIFVTALEGARTYTIEGGRLRLLAMGGDVLATLAPPAKLAGTSWRATAVDNGKQAVVSLVADSSLTFQGAAATRKTCGRPELMEQEQRFLKALETVSTARVEGDTLELRTAAGALAVTLARAAR